MLHNSVSWKFSISNHHPVLDCVESSRKAKLRYLWHNILIEIPFSPSDFLDSGAEPGKRITRSRDKKKIKWK